MVKLNVIKGKATIEEGGDSFLGKLLANHKGKIKYKTPLAKGEFEITNERPIEPKPKPKKRRK